MTWFTKDAVRFAEALHRSEAHCEVACELYGAGRVADAILHSVRPIADTFPWLETELRSHPEQLRDLMVAVSSLSGALRHGVRPRVARRHLKEVKAACGRALDAVVGRSADDPTFRISVGLSLLRSACASYERGVPDGNLNAYQSAYGLARAGTALVEAGIGGGDDALKVLGSLRAALPTLDPPPRLLTPTDLAALVDGLAASLPETGTDADELTLLETLLADVVRAYDDGVPALAARLAASLYVRTYDPLRPKLRSRDESKEARLAEILGVELRRAINDGVAYARIAGLAAEARSLSSDLAAASPRGDGALNSAH